MQDFENFQFSFFNEMQYFCLKNCFFQNMEYYGIKDAFLHIKLGLNFKVVSSNSSFSVYKHDSLLPLYEMESVECGSGDDFEVVFEDNLKELPVIVLVDVFYLPYRKEFHKYHASHAIFMTGYKINENKVKIIDWYSPYFYKGDIMIEDYKKARISQNPKDINPFSNFAIKNYWYRIRAEKINLTPAENIKKNIADMRQTFLDDVHGIFGGTFAFERIIFYLQNCNIDEKKQVTAACKHVHNELFILYRAAILAKKYFNYAFYKYPDHCDPSYLEIINDLSVDLEKINFNLLKGSLLCSEQTLTKIRFLFEEVIRLYQKMKEI